jgi:hypothetical protein
MKNSLRIKSEKWPEVTDKSHYIVELNYEGYSYSFDDIYFDDLNNIIFKLKTLEKERKGTVQLDGGFRFKVAIKSTAPGGIVLNFKVESGAEFPGKLTLEGHFPVEGGNTAIVIGRLVKLFSDGNEFFI